MFGGTRGHHGGLERRPRALLAAGGDINFGGGGLALDFGPQFAGAGLALGSVLAGLAVGLRARRRGWRPWARGAAGGVAAAGLVTGCLWPAELAPLPWRAAAG